MLAADEGGYDSRHRVRCIYLRLYPADQAAPPASTLNYVAGQTRANNAIVGLSPSGALAIRCAQASGTAHVVLDVTGYFE